METKMEKLLKLKQEQKGKISDALEPQLHDPRIKPQ